MYMQKKTYVVPSFDVFELEGEPILTGAESFTGSLNPDNEEDENDPGKMSNKRQPSAPWSKSPWE